MTIYFVLLGLLACLYLIKNVGEKIILKKTGALYLEQTKKSKMFNLCVCLIISIVFIVISTFRGMYVGYDTINYKTYYDFKVNNLNAKGFELIFEWFCFVCAKFNMPFQVLLCICAIITFSAIFYATIKFSAEPVMSLFLFIALGILGNTFNAVRQYLALAVFLFSLKYIINGKFFNYMICCLIAFLLHSSAIVLFPLYFLRYVKFNYKTIIISLVLSIIGVVCLKPLTRLVSVVTKINYYDRYFNNPEFYQPITPYYMCYALGLIAVFIFLFLIRKKVKEKNDFRLKIYDTFLLLFYISVLIRFFGTISGYFSLVNRFNIYFFIAIIFLIPIAINSLPKPWKLIGVFGAFAGGTVYCIISGVIRKTNGVYPYNFIWGDNAKLTIIFYSIFAIYCLMMIILTILQVKTLRPIKKNEPKKVIITRSTAIFNDSRTIKLIKELLNLGYDVTVLGWDRLGQYKENEKYTVNGKTANIKLFKLRAEFGSGVKNILKMMMFQIWLKWQIKSMPERSIIHACDFDTASPVYDVLTKQKLVYDIFDYFAESRKMPKLLQIVFKVKENYIASEADATIICMEQRIKQIKGAHPKKLVVIHNTPDLNLNEIDNSTINIEQSNKLKVVYVGVLGDDRLIEEIAKECGKHKQFEFYFGGVGKFAKTIEAYATDNNNMHYFGSMQYADVLQLEKQCDVLFATYNPEIPNHKYSAPNKFYEAGALSKPIIVCKNTGIDELVKKFDCGVAIGYNTAEFFGELQKYNENKELCNRQGVNGNACYKSNFSWDIMKERIKNLYEDLSK